VAVNNSFLLHCDELEWVWGSEFFSTIRKGTPFHFYIVDSRICDVFHVFCCARLYASQALSVKKADQAARV
jgi:hypothetical protein